MKHWFAKRAAPIAVLALGLPLSGCGFVSVDWNEVNGVPLAELDMSGEAPDTIQLAGPDKIIITQGGDLTITVEGDAEASAALRFDRDGERLSIARDQEIYDGPGRAVIRIAMPAPENLEIAGSGNIESDSLAARGELEIAGSGNITVTAIDAEELNVDIAGSGNVTAAGSAQKLSVDIAGNGNVLLGELMASTVAVSIAGSGNVDVASNGTVAADIAGSGNITVTGSAACTVQSVGSGSLTCSPASSDDADEEGGDGESETAAITAAAEDGAAE